MAENFLTEEVFDSSYYQLLYQSDIEDKNNFVKKLAQRLHIPAMSKILEVGCKTGEHSKAIAEMGFDVTGTDFSEKMINQAKNFEDENLHFYKHDIRLPFWMNYFDYAFNLFTSFGHFKTVREHDNAIRSISQSLKTNASFIMDYLNVHYEETHMRSEEKKIGNLDFSITKSHDHENFYTITEIKEQGILKETLTQKLLKLSIGDFTDMFAYQGLQIQEVFGDYNFSNYDIRNSPRLIMIAKKIRR